jgi:hypothetical protein
MNVKKSGIATNSEKKKYIGKNLINFADRCFVNNQGRNNVAQDNLK